MAQYQLTYLDMRGRAEPARIIFAVAGVPYEDIRVTYEDLPKLKPNLPYGQVPILKVGDEVLSQSLTINRFLSRKFGLLGNTDFEAAKIDEIVDALHEYECKYWESCMLEDKEAKEAVIKKFLEDATPPMMMKFCDKLEKNGGQFLVGKALSYADIYLFNVIDYYGHLTKTDLIEYHPVLQSFCKGVGTIPAIQAWIAKRPDSTM